MNTTTSQQVGIISRNYDLLDTGMMKMPFGQHAGKELSEVPRNYKIWLLTQTLRSFPALYAELRRHVIELLKAEAHAADLAAFHASIEQIEKMASGEDLV